MSPSSMLFTCTILFRLYKNPVIIPILQLRKQFREANLLAIDTRTSVNPMDPSVFSVTDLC